MDTVALKIQDGTEVTISAVDYDRMSKHKWTFFKKYPYAADIGCFLHHYIIGARPTDVPEEYVVDHANRNKTDASIPNLRWVSPSFNSWNRSTSVISSTPYKGVHWDRSKRTWIAKFCGKSLGSFSDAREAFVRYTAAVLQKWPVWASTSDLIVGPGLLSEDEVKQALAQVVPFQEKARTLPRGVEQQKNRFRATFRHRHSRLVATVAEAEALYCKAQKAHTDAQWAAHITLPIPVNGEGQAVIQLSGNAGRGMVSTVPSCLWHVLTFGHSWNIDEEGYARGTWGNKSVGLHVMVYTFLHPMFIPRKGISIDHINHIRLDNTDTNLRPATQSLQGRNRAKMEGTTSQHVGVCLVRNKRRPWKAGFRYNGRRYDVGYWKTEEDALHALDKRKAVVIKD